MPAYEYAMRELAFRTLVELAERCGGEELLGSTAPRAVQIYRRSLIGQTFPSFWLEVPLLGKAGFDLHVCYERGQVGPHDRFAHGCGFGMQALFDWFFGEDTGGVGVEFAHDLRGAEAATGAYVNFNHRPLVDLPGFFAALDVTDELEGATELLERLPEEWTPWYIGLFPGRPGAGTRVGAFVTAGRQREYAGDLGTIEHDLTQARFSAFDEQMIRRLQMLAAHPYRLELQLDATEGGTGTTLGADLTLRLRTEGQIRAAFSGNGDAAQACRLLEAWGMADDRWRRVANVALSRAVPLPQGTVNGRSTLLMTCTPAFIKAKWTGEEPQPAKVYLQCAARPI